MASITAMVPDPMRDWVQGKIDSGRYAHVGHDLRDLAATAGRNRTVDDIGRSIDDVRSRGRTLPAAEMFDRIESRLRGMPGGA